MSGDWIQKFFDSKGLKIKISSMLNLSDDAGNKPKEFSIS